MEYLQDIRDFPHQRRLNSTRGILRDRQKQWVCIRLLEEMSVRQYEIPSRTQVRMKRDLEDYIQHNTTQCWICINDATLVSKQLKRVVCFTCFDAFKDQPDLLSYQDNKSCYAYA